MEVRRATITDLDTVINNLQHAKAIMYATGNIHQWSPNYPPKDKLISDIENEHCYIAEENGYIVASFTFIIGVDPTYNIIKGKWLNQEEYAVIHRIASNGKSKGVGSKIIQWCLNQHSNIRIDTHQDNTIMQHLLKKLSFTYCGIIICDDGTERLAFQHI